MAVDAVVLEDVLGYIHNWFERDTLSTGECVIEDGTLPAGLGIPEGAWYRIQGSLLNDGMHLRGDDGLVDEAFTGTITTHAIPKALLAVVEEVSEWTRTYGFAASSPYQSESFGGYSYSKGSQGTTSGGTPSSGWQAAFAGRFTKWRKLS